MYHTFRRSFKAAAAAVGWSAKPRLPLVEASRCAKASDLYRQLRAGRASVRQPRMHMCCSYGACRQYPAVALRCELCFWRQQSM